MTRKIHDLAVVIGKYTKDGQEKNRYQTIGAMFEKDDRGRFIIIEPWFNPAGCPHEPGKGIMVSMFDPKQGGNNGQGSAGSEEQFESDKIPF